MSLRIVSAIKRMLLNILRYRLHISLIFTFLLYYNNLRAGIELNCFLIVSFSLWHFALFLYDRIYDRAIDKLSQPDEFIPENQARILYGLVLIILLISFSFYFYTGFNLVYWALLFPVTFLYTYPVWKDIRLKNIFIVKNLYSAVLIFCGPLLLQSYILHGEQMPSYAFSSLTSLFIYVIIGEIFWDIRDATVDKMNNVFTIPNVLGIRAAKFVMLLLIVVDFMLSSYQVNVSAIIYLALITFIKEKTDRFVYHLPPLIALLRFVL